MKLIGSFLGIAICAVVNVVGASDSTVYPASLCKYYGPQSDDTYFTPSGGNATGLKNSDTANHAAVCPVVRMSTFSSHISMAVVNVSGTSWTTSDCSVRETTWDGTQTYQSGTATLTSSGNTSQFYWSGTVTPGYDYSNYAVYCGVVRPGQWIRKYEIQES